MGLFDNVKCAYPLPWPEVQDALWQSYDTPDQHCSEYEIHEDGTLWYLDAGWRHLDNFWGELEIHHSVCPVTGPNEWYSVRFWFRAGVVSDAIFDRDGKIEEPVG